jgi:hypothetical protein
MSDDYKARKRRNQAAYVERKKKEGRVRVEIWPLEQHKDYVVREVKRIMEDLEK